MSPKIYKELESKYTDLKQENRKLSDENEALLSAKTAAENELKQLQSAYDTTVAERDRLQSEYDVAKASLDNLKASNYLSVPLSNEYKIIGNVYRPNSAPLADLAKAISTHQNIILGLKSNKSHKSCDFQILSDFNVNILNFAQHELTNTYLESMFSAGLLPVITRPTRIHHMSATLIDHIFESNKSNRYIAGILLTSLSDHFPTFYIEECKTQKISQKPFKTRIINEKTIPGYENILKTAPWGSVMKEDPKSSFDCFF